MTKKKKDDALNYSFTCYADCRLWRLIIALLTVVFIPVHRILYQQIYCISCKLAHQVVARLGSVSC